MIIFLSPTVQFLNEYSFVLKAPIASIFWMDDLASELYLDGIVVMVDSYHCLEVGFRLKLNA